MNHYYTAVQVSRQTGLPIYSNLHHKCTPTQVALWISALDSILKQKQRHGESRFPCLAGFFLNSRWKPLFRNEQQISCPEHCDLRALHKFGLMYTEWDTLCQARMGVECDLSWMHCWEFKSRSPDTLVFLSAKPDSMHYSVPSASWAQCACYPNHRALMTETLSLVH